jgi:hypothetical protein
VCLEQDMMILTGATQRTKTVCFCHGCSSHIAQNNISLLLCFFL